MKKCCYGQVKFCALGGATGRFLTECGRQGIRLENITAVPGGIEAITAASKYKAASRIARKYRAKMKVVERFGMAFPLTRWKGKWAAATALVSFCMAIWLYGNVIWSVQWIGVDPSWQSEIRQVLYSMNICEGAILTQNQIRICEKQLVNQIPQLSWASLNLGKGRLTVEASFVSAKPVIENNEIADLTAAENGVILSTEVQEGVLQKKQGQSIAKGDVLISAGRQDRDGRRIPVPAKGKITARVIKSYSCSQNVKQQEICAYGRLQKAYRLFVLGRWFEMNKSPVPLSAKRVLSPATFFGLSFPATIEESLWLPSKKMEIVLTEEQALERAKSSCMKQLYSEFPDAKIELQTEEKSMQGETFVYSTAVQFTANVAKVISTEKN